jgi:hypothetical protein
MPRRPAIHIFAATDLTQLHRQIAHRPVCRLHSSDVKYVQSGGVAFVRRD